MDTSAEFASECQYEGILDVDVESIAVARLIEEVRGADFEVTRAYNRTYNRHNR
jgi:hypothetical protein